MSEIAELNDKFRRAGPYMLTAAIEAYGRDFVVLAVEGVRWFSDFNEDNDPKGEHDFGMFTLAGQQVCWKIDYYTKPARGQMCHRAAAEDPADPTKTDRLLTIMLASEL